jgi:hypothetical protein
MWRQDAMPRYFFHLRDQDILYEDAEGMELPDIGAALAEALRVDKELTAVPAGLYGLEYEITDAAGKPLLKVPIQERRRNRSSSPPPEADERRRASDKKKPLH